MTFDLFGNPARRSRRKRNAGPFGLTPLNFSGPREKSRRRAGGGGGGLFGFLAGGGNGNGAGLSRAEKRKQKARERKLRRELARQRRRDTRRVKKQRKEERRWLRRQAMAMRSGSAHRSARQLMLLANAVGVSFNKDDSAELFNYATEHTEANYDELLRATFIGRRLDVVLEPYHIPEGDGDDAQDRARWIGAVAEKYGEWTRTQNVTTAGQVADELIETLGATPEEIKSLEAASARGEAAQVQREQGVDPETARRIREERVRAAFQSDVVTLAAPDFRADIAAFDDRTQSIRRADPNAPTEVALDDRPSIRSTNRLVAWMGGIIARLRGYG